MFNPISIAQNLEMINLGMSLIDEKNPLVHQDGLWHSLQHHSRFSHSQREEVISMINMATQNTHDFLQSVDLLILTLGTAHVHRYRETGEVVANCHKISANEFVKELLDSTTVYQRLAAIFDELFRHRPDLQIILTVSPVRYIRNGLIESNRSKAVLLTAVHQLVNDYTHCHYFPAYEIQIDELRDYRFYEKDMVHPNRQAIDHILQKFVKTYFDVDARRQVKACDSIMKALNHRPKHPGSTAHRKFVDQTKASLAVIKKDFPHLDFSEEEQLIESQIS